MRRFFVGLAMLCAPVVGSAQLSYEFTNFQTTFTGFTTTLQFRNVNSYLDPYPVLVRSPIVVRLSQPVKDFCVTTIYCSISGVGGAVHPGYLYAIGAIQTTGAPAGNAMWRPSGLFTNEDSCGGMYCTFRAFGIFESQRFLGCQVPYVPNGPIQIEYTARTCDADGFTGWIGLDLRFDFSPFSGRPVVMPAFTANDLTANFTVQTVATVTPEPATWALMLVGLGAIALGRLKRTR